MKTDSEIILEAYYDKSNVDDLKKRLDKLWYDNEYEQMWILFCKFFQNNYGVDFRDEIKEMKRIQNEHIYKVGHLSPLLRLSRNVCINKIEQKVREKAPEDIVNYLLSTDPENE